MSNARILANLMGTSTTIPSSKLSLAAADMPSGTVLQTQQTVFKGQFTDSLTTNNEEEVVTGLNCTITPTSTNSKILVQYLVHVGAASFYDIGINLYRSVTANTGTHPLGTFLKDSSANDIKGAAAGNRPVSFGVATLYASNDVGIYKNLPCHGCALDHPNSTSALTYSFAFHYYAWSSAAVYVNRTSNFANNSQYDHMPVSTMTLMEIAG